ncbi:endonuclease/exonuclease/phosphatase (EEP) superfamily protein YafD [Amycolatopsis bartoniae]|uniref:Endonuclease n=1 Tax=Amycolatopsis bartoniae TaxID=941986 RepID=A0A8H9M7H8_9PSEU|nr:endonuclease/exonuclease/phosphatase family protein [Amycolatopsis bartoniae]MBB2935123.1 endonuclease/exonuclease/phosphatase (EEP) superfamily protein YafD [Amycolatopsis bartoniae]TVT07000.1 endonuclease/exonuclease/phosphatase family protein [Amycolatopsis bartoniae]GHF74520.1 endonuclease [Amycolatopsis bartoniae]
MIVLAVLALGFLEIAVMRLLGFDGNKVTAALIALTPYVTAAGLVLGGVSLALRHWWIGGIVLVVALALVGMLLPRTFASAQPAAHGAKLRVMSSNQYLGRADVQSIVRLVRENQVDVLNLLELTPREVTEFEQAGLFELLPYRVFKPVSGGAGSGIASRYPLTELSLAGPSRMKQPSARVDVHGTPVEVVAVHPIPPTTDADEWKKELAGLPKPDQHGAVRVLAGDFNSTVDHAAFRKVLGTGYTDAGLTTGSGFTSTWPSSFFPPPVTIDHVLVDPRVAVDSYRVLDVPDSDHHAVLAELTLP